MGVQFHPAISNTVHIAIGSDYLECAARKKGEQDLFSYTILSSGEIESSLRTLK
jgi:leucyl aminopeptidase (aminopeptidase T)